jgi:hypothetical protein
MAEITSIQKELDTLDQCDAEDESMHYRLRRNEWYDGWDKAQKDLLDKLRTKLLEYGKLAFHHTHSPLCNGIIGYSTRSDIVWRSLMRRRISRGYLTSR